MVYILQNVKPILWFNPEMQQFGLNVFTLETNRFEVAIVIIIENIDFELQMPPPPPPFVRLIIGSLARDFHIGFDPDYEFN